MLKLVVLAVLLGVAYSKDFIFENRRGDTIWVGTLGNAGLPPPSNGGFSLGPGEQVYIISNSYFSIIVYNFKFFLQIK